MRNPWSPGKLRPTEASKAPSDKAKPERWLSYANSAVDVPVRTLVVTARSGEPPLTMRDVGIVASAIMDRNIGSNPAQTILVRRTFLRGTAVLLEVEGRRAPEGWIASSSSWN